MNLPPGRRAGNEWVLDFCPGCGRKEKCWFNLHKERGICYRCGLVIGSLQKLLELAGGGAEVEDDPSVPRLPGGGQLPPSLWCAHAWDAEEGRRFLASRRVTEEVCRSVPVWWVNEPERRGIAVRLDPLSPEFPREAYAYRDCPLERGIWMSPGVHSRGYAFGWEAFLSSGRNCVLLVEGIFDLLSTGLYGWGVACLGTSVKNSLAVALLRRGISAVVWFDAEDGGVGKAQARRAVERLRCWGVKARIIDSERDPKRYLPEECAHIRDYLGAA